jgi:hypothetical protein
VEGGAEVKFKLRIVCEWCQGRKQFTLTREFVWQNKADALACKALIEKAQMPKNTKLAFVEFVEEKPLESEVGK